MIWNHWVNERLFDVRNVEVLRETLLPELPSQWRAEIIKAVGFHRPDLASRLSRPPYTDGTLDMAALNDLVHGEPIATPIDLTPRMEEQLKASHQYAPLYFTFAVNLLNVTAERRMVSEVDRFQWTLIPAYWKPSIANSLPVLRRLQGMSLPYWQRTPSRYLPGLLFQTDLEQNWTPAWRGSDFVLYEHRRNMTATQVHSAQ